MVSADLERKIINEISAALSAASLTDLALVRGTWQPSATDAPRWLEGDLFDGRTALIAVAVGTPAKETYSIPLVTFAASVRLHVRAELDSNGVLLLQFADVLQALFARWQVMHYNGDTTALDLPTLSIDGVTVNGGGVPEVSAETISIEFPLTLIGSYRSISDNSNNSED